MIATECIECEGVLIDKRCINPDCPLYSIKAYIKQLKIKYTKLQVKYQRLKDRQELKNN